MTLKSYFVKCSIICSFVIALFFLSSPLVSANSLSQKENTLSLEKYIKAFYQEGNFKARGIDYQIVRHSIIGYYNSYRQKKESPNANLITIVDFRKPANQQRFYIIDLELKKVVLQTWVAHGEKSGLLYARQFSNKPDSWQSSLGCFLTAQTYDSQTLGTCLRLDGQEEKFNSNARKRSIVLHSAPYVSKTYIDIYGVLGRSYGCLSLPPNEIERVISLIKDKYFLITYSDDLNYLNESEYMSYSKANAFFIEINKNNVKNIDPKKKTNTPEVLVSNEGNIVEIIPLKTSKYRRNFITIKSSSAFPKHRSPHPIIYQRKLPPKPWLLKNNY